MLPTGEAPVGPGGTYTWEKLFPPPKLLSDMHPDYATRTGMIRSRLAEQSTHQLPRPSFVRGCLEYDVRGFSILHLVQDFLR